MSNSLENQQKLYTRATILILRGSRICRLVSNTKNRNININIEVTQIFFGGNGMAKEAQSNSNWKRVYGF